MAEPEKTNQMDVARKSLSRLCLLPSASLAPNRHGRMSASEQRCSHRFLSGKQLLRRLRFGLAREFVSEDMLKLGTQLGQAGAGDAPKHRYVEIKVRMEPDGCAARSSEATGSPDVSPERS